jgi:UDP-N-acetylmuramoylalanine-D-glutamate ligase
LLQPEHFGIAPQPGAPLLSGIEECSLVCLSPGLKIHHEPLRALLEQCEACGAEVIGELELAARHCPAPISL